MWTVVDGDGTVPCYSSAADGLKANARFEIRQSEHVKLLFDPRVLNIIAAIFGLWKYEDKEEIYSFQTFKCQYLTELERIIQQAQNSD
ncbi:MAG: hypothetical protein EZS28_003763 [Streblomastix strix]|uniref:Uncharacterized protein n=1 Tax=Streblomastix strix TaxID=222440 RepID=A0A5J4X0F4_9EUKA|nr:MAG: hypothetical protein EZS28_003763 [Streblomastix strix]